MSAKRLYTLLGVLAGLLLLYAGLRFATARGGAPVGGDPLGLGGVVPERVDSVVFSGPRDTVRLVRRDGGYMAGRWRADSARVEELWRAVDSVVVAELVSRSPANHPRLGVADSAATRVAFYAGADRVAELLVGQSGPAWRTAYVRRPGADEVYLVRGELATLAHRRRDDWRDREIARFEPFRADRVEIVLDGESTTLERQDTLWTVAAGGAEPVPADTAAVRRAVETLSQMTSTSFAADSVAETLDFGAPEGRVAVRDEAENVLAELLLRRREDGSWYVRRADRPDVWVLSRFSLEDVLRKPEDFRRRGPTASG